MAITSRLDQYASLVSTEFDEITKTNISISTGGTFYANEFSENLETTQILANTFPAYNIITSEFASELYGVGQGTYMRHTTTGTCIIYNEIDEITNLI